tara:strand:+ start:74 stop:202 length:129 start_codon:yes stop_codon:yes gene_type:complete
MSDFISGFFSWGKSKKVEEPKEKEEKEVKEKPKEEFTRYEDE